MLVTIKTLTNTTFKIELAPTDTVISKILIVARLILIANCFVLHLKDQRS
jgi:hypothetical protein